MRENSQSLTVWGCSCEREQSVTYCLGVFMSMEYLVWSSDTLKLGCLETLQLRMKSTEVQTLAELRMRVPLIDGLGY